MPEFDPEFLPKGLGTPLDRDDMTARGEKTPELGGFADHRHPNSQAPDDEKPDARKYLAG